MKMPNWRLLFIPIALMTSPAFGIDPAALKPDQVQIVYEPPSNAAHQVVFKLAKDRQVLEKVKEFLSPIRLPRVLTLKMKGCDGESNAWYELDTVTVCYEAIKETVDEAPKKTTPAGVTPTDAVVGPVTEVFLHESSHAIFDLLEIPILGREEDAADQLAAYVILNFNKEDARRLIGGIAYSYRTLAKSRRWQIGMRQFADEHGHPAQRYFNYLCMAYGADSTFFADAVKQGKLPKNRAEQCEAEYQQVDFAFKKLVTPYIDSSMSHKVRSKK